MKIVLKVRSFKFCIAHRIDMSKGTDLARSDSSKECMICNYWFYNRGFKFQDSVCTGSHVLTVLSVNISAIAIITTKNIDYHCIVNNISKYEAINL